MDKQHIALARKCLDAAYDRSMSFPEIVGALIGGGFEGYSVDYRRSSTTYFRPDGDSVVLDNRSSDASVNEVFDQKGVAAQIKWAQSNAPDYSYAAFCRNVKALGCAGYIVSFLGKRVLYFGRSAETHVEHFPQ